MFQKFSNPRPIYMPVFSSTRWFQIRKPHCDPPLVAPSTPRQSSSSTACVPASFRRWFGELFRPCRTSPANSAFTPRFISIFSTPSCIPFHESIIVWSFPMSSFSFRRSAPWRPPLQSEIKYSFSSPTACGVRVQVAVLDRQRSPHA
jgi:hypothetical protein